LIEPNKKTITAKGKIYYKSTKSLITKL